MTAQAGSSATYMLSENYCYTKSNMLIEALVAQGLFGTVYYAEGEYLHDLKDLNEITRWRRVGRLGLTVSPTAPTVWDPFCGGCPATAW